MAILGACALPLAEAAAQEGPEEWQQGAPMGWNFKNLSPEQQQRMIRFSTFVNKRLPQEYVTAQNDVGYTIERDCRRRSPLCRALRPLPWRNRPRQWGARDCA